MGKVVIKSVYHHGGMLALKAAHIHAVSHCGIR